MDRLNLNDRKKNNELYDEGLALFLVKQPDNRTNFYFNNYIPQKFIDYINIAGSLLRMRNIIIVLTIVEIFSAILGFSYYFIRRVSRLLI
jgi:hypothetical protein